MNRENKTTVLKSQTNLDKLFFKTLFRNCSKVVPSTQDTFFPPAFKREALRLNFKQEAKNSKLLQGENTSLGN